MDDEQLQGCILAAQNDLAISETQAKSWRDDEDSDGGRSSYYTSGHDLELFVRMGMCS